MVVACRGLELLLRAALPQQWEDMGLPRLLKFLTDLRRQRRALSAPDLARVRAIEACMRYNNVIDAVLQRDYGWRPEGGAAEGLSVEGEWAELRLLVGALDADPRVQTVLDHLSREAIEGLARTARTDQALARAAHEVLHGASPQVSLADVERRLRELGRDVEAYVSEVRGASIWNSLLRLWPTAKQVRERAVQLEEAEALDGHLASALVRQRAALRALVGGPEWDGLTASYSGDLLAAMEDKERLAVSRRDRLLQQLQDVLLGRHDHNGMDDGDDDRTHQPAAALEGDGARLEVCGVEELEAPGGSVFHRVHYQLWTRPVSSMHRLTCHRLLPHKGQLERLLKKQQQQAAVKGVVKGHLQPVLSPVGSVRVSKARSLLLFRLVADNKAVVITRINDDGTTPPGAEGEEATGSSVSGAASSRVDVHVVSLRAARAGAGLSEVAELEELEPLHTIYRSVSAVDLHPSTHRLVVAVATEESTELMVYRFDTDFSALVRDTRLLLGTEPAAAAAAGSGQARPARHCRSLHLLPTPRWVVLSWGDGSVTMADYSPQATRGEQPILPPTSQARARLVVTGMPATLGRVVMLALTPAIDHAAAEGPIAAAPLLQAFEVTAKGPQHLDLQDQHDALQQMRLQPWQGEGALALLPLGKVQDHAVWVDQESGQLCSLRLDGLLGEEEQQDEEEEGEEGQQPEDQGSEAGQEGGGQDDKAEEGAAVRSSNGRLDMVYHLYDKFPVLGPGGRGGVLAVMAEQTAGGGDRDEEAAAAAHVVADYLRRVLEAVKERGCKDVLKDRQLRLDLLAWDDAAAAAGLLQRAVATPASEWVSNLLCLLPIQIARVERGRLIALRDGQPLAMPEGVGGQQQQQTVEDLCRRVRFGPHEWVLRQMRDRGVQVVAAIGAQSTGKSYLLNHLGGAFFDVAGGRCTDGVWMTVRPGPALLEEEDNTEPVQVLLDFEGLGSFERTEHEDMLMVRQPWTATEPFHDDAQMSDVLYDSLVVACRACWRLVWPTRPSCGRTTSWIGTRSRRWSGCRWALARAGWGTCSRASS